MQPDAGTLETVLRAAQGGDVAAFNTLVVVYQRQVYNVCYRTLGNGDDAADATQDALLSAFRGLKTFQGTATGLTTICAGASGDPPTVWTHWPRPIASTRSAPPSAWLTRARLPSSAA